MLTSPGAWPPSPAPRGSPPSPRPSVPALAPDLPEMTRFPRPLGRGPLICPRSHGPGCPRAFPWLSLGTSPGPRLRPGRGAGARGRRVPPQRQTFICSVRSPARELPRSRRFPGTPRGTALTAEPTGSHRRVPLGAGRRVAGLGGTRRAGRRRAGTKPRARGTPANSRGAHVRHRGKYKCQSSDRHRGPRGAVHAATGPPRAQSRSSRTGRAARCPRRPAGRRS